MIFMMKNKSKFKFFKLFLVLLIIIVVVQLGYIFLFGVENKIITLKSNCNIDKEKLKEIGKVEGIDLYSYCIEDIKFLNSDGNFNFEKELLKGSHYVTMVWDGGTKIYKGINYYITDCHNLSGHIRYIISNLNNQEDTWKKCRAEN